METARITQYSIPIIIPTYEPEEDFISHVSSLLEISNPVVIVDDGSGENYREIFDKTERLTGVTILRHALNLGKGRALKDAFNYVLNEYPNVVGVVTVDSDGQHLIKDVKEVIAALSENSDGLILGCRDFSGEDIPWKSRFGNNLTRKVCAYLCGVNVSDTQTGLRGIPISFVRILMYTPGERYEYETNMLLECNNSIRIREVPITTVYDSREEHKTHFDPLRDSFTIYKVILVYSLSSVLATVIDFLVFSVATWLGYSIWFSTAFARVGAAFVNFLLNRNVVFKSKGNVGKQLLKYTILVFISGALSAFIISRLRMIISANLMVVKAIVETGLFFFNYYVQRTFIFVKRKGDEIEKSLFSDEITENTDWTKYYQKKKSWVSSFTQRYTLQRILDAIDKYTEHKEGLDICELGGGNSCFCEKLCKKVKVYSYDIIDSNPLAVKLFKNIEMNAKSHDGICRDLLLDKDSGKSEYNFVYSIGLIEHFRGDDIRTMIKRHFEYCRDGGIVLITFPTPTRKYLFIRKMMEFLGVWQFHDEKPILYNEVSECFEQYGTVVEHYINRRLPLTQEVVITRKGGEV